MRIMITGGAGFIGSHIAEALIAKGHEVECFDNLSQGKVSNLPDPGYLYPGDLSFAKDVRDYFAGSGKPDYVIHCAAQTDVRVSVESPYADARQNIMNSLSLLAAMDEFGCRRIMFLSSGGAVYDDSVEFPNENSPTLPKCPYGIAKLSVEHYLRFYADVRGFETTVLRLANVYGPRNVKGVIRIFADAMANDRPITLNGEGRQVRDFIHVRDVASAACHLIGERGVYNVGTGEGTSVGELKGMLHKITGTEPHSDDTVKAHIPGEAIRSVLDTAKIRSSGWHPKISLEQGLSDID